MKKLNTNCGTGEACLALAAGLSVGVGLALLFAPRKGEDLRRSIQGSVEGQLDKVRTGAQAARGAWEAGKTEFRDRLADARQPTNPLADLPAVLGL